MIANEFDSKRTNELRKQLVDMSTSVGQHETVRRQPKPTFKAGAPKRKGKNGKIAFALAATVAGLLVLGQVNLSAQSAHAVEVLYSTADLTKNFSDPVPGPGQYLQVSTHANWMVSGDTFRSYMEEQMIDVYVPGSANREWVLDRDWGDRKTKREVIHAVDGEFYDGSSWISTEFPDLSVLPRDGTALYKLIDAGYSGASASRAEDNFVRITNLLRNGLVPADLRAGLYQALALVPGVTIAEDQKNFDGKSGTAIGRTEALRSGQREEIIIDPDTGLVIGERSIMTVAAFGFGLNQVTGHTAISYNIVDSAPEATAK